jgi:hypothetical protein
MRSGLLLVILLAQSATAQQDSAHRGGAAVSGVVYDSVAHRTLAGATVQIAATDSLARFSQAVVADSLGRFTIDDVPAGHYIIGFVHPMLDSLGIEPPPRQLTVGRQPVTIDLAIPSAKRLGAAFCGTNPVADPGGVVTGRVLAARDAAPVAGVSVAAEWLEYTLSRDGMTRHVAQRTAITNDRGWFALCNAPSAGTVTLVAVRGADSTDHIEASIPQDGLLRRELYLGNARSVVLARDTTPGADPAAPPRRVRAGDGRLTGTVIAAEGGRPLFNAQVGIVDGPQTHTNERGEWTLVNAPDGTRVLDVRAVTFYPMHMAVNVVAGAAPVRISLSTLKAILDTVKVTAARLGDRRQNGFEERRKTGMGRYLTAADLAARGTAIFTSDVFRTIPGLRLNRAAHDSTTLMMRSMAGDWCAPAFYIDGHYIPGFTADDLDGFMTASDIASLEVYTGGAIPAQFQPALTGCGSIVIWTK